jgi:hypothetical protein
MHASSAVVGLVVLTTLGFGSPALAHDPIFISDDQTTPDTGPYMPDGSISWALYGTVLGAGDTRGFEFDLRDGDELSISLLIPNLSPETELADDELPVIELMKPDGTTTVVTPFEREVFDEPFSNTSYIGLADLREPGQAGRYQGRVIGHAASRFSVAIGVEEIFFTETERSGERPTSFADIGAPLAAWYGTPPGGDNDTSALGEGEAEIDLELVEGADGEADVEADAQKGADGVGDVVAEAGDETNIGRVADAARPQAAAAEVATARSDTRSGTTWVAPVVIVAVALLGAGALLIRRSRFSAD